jgi:hypothetical protein
MTAEESLQMAREAGLLGLDAEGRLERFRKLAYEAGVRAEREACAKECDAVSASADKAAVDGQYLVIRNGAEARRCAAAIRARSNA